jgi:hypothetical protein
LSIEVYTEYDHQEQKPDNARKIMKKSLLGAFASMALLCFSAGAWADAVSEVFECELKKNKTIADAQAVNKGWLAFMKANVSEDITSTAATVVVGKSDGFLYVDTYPDLATWAAGQAALETDEGEAATSGFDDVMECEKSTLYNVNRTE